MTSGSWFLLLILPVLVGSTSVFKSASDPAFVTSYRCPGPYVLNNPWYPDDQDCSCYYVCGVHGNAARMCCPDGLWWEHESKTCKYYQDFNNKHQERCKNMVRGVGTTKQLREIFLGRCWEYQRYITPEGFQDGYRDCEDLFDTFARAFVNKAPCKDVTADDYSELVQKSTIDLPADSQVFWSGTYGLAQEYVTRGQRGFTLETTLIGYMLNDVTWCGATVAPGINFESCPAFASCSNHVMASFWAKALESFAGQAHGIVTVILNGSRTDGPAFRNNSFFAEHEFPNLDPEKVSLIRVWVAHDLDRPTTETCSAKGSLDMFRKIAEENGFQVECTDNPGILLHLLCAYQPDKPQCQLSPSNTARTQYQQFSAGGPVVYGTGAGGVAPQDYSPNSHYPLDQGTGLVEDIHGSDPAYGQNHLQGLTQNVDELPSATHDQTAYFIDDSESNSNQKVGAENMDVATQSFI